MHLRQEIRRLVTASTRWSDDGGQDLAEYALLLFLIALVAVAGVTAVGTSQFWNVWTAVGAAL